MGGSVRLTLTQCLILKISTSTKHLQNLLRDGTLSVISIVKKISTLGSLDIAKNAKRQFFLATRYNVNVYIKDICFTHNILRLYKKMSKYISYL